MGASAGGDRAGALTSPSLVRELLRRHGLAADKGFGQNFLVDAHALADIVAAARLDAGDTAFEVGPGLGVLTRELALHAASVVSVELDRRLAPVLDETVGDLSNVSIVWQDALAFDLAALPEGVVLVANLPYNIATPLLVRCLEARGFARMVFLVQREVGERLVARAGSPAYGALSVVVAHWAEAEIVRHVKPGAFLPPPEVTSSLVRLTPRPQAVADPELMDFVHTCFRHRRKTLLKNLDLAGLPREPARAALMDMGLDPRARAETLSLGQFRELWHVVRRADRS